jgi:hypothetical protein
VPRHKTLAHIAEIAGLDATLLLLRGDPLARYGTPVLRGVDFRQLFPDPFELLLIHTLPRPGTPGSAVIPFACTSGVMSSLHS